MSRFKLVFSEAVRSITRRRMRSTIAWSWVATTTVVPVRLIR